MTSGISDQLAAEQQAALACIRRVFEQLAAGIPGFDDQTGDDDDQ